MAEQRMKNAEKVMAEEQRTVLQAGIKCVVVGVWAAIAVVVLCISSNRIDLRT